MSSDIFPKKNTNSIRIASWNVCHGVNRAEAFLKYNLSDANLDIIHLCELEIDDRVSDCNFSIPGFQTFTKWVTRNRGGVEVIKCRNLVSVKEGTFDRLERMEQEEGRRAEIWLRAIRAGHKDMILVFVYNEWTPEGVPGYDHDIRIEELGKIADSDVYIAGDFNLQLNSILNEKTSYPHFKRGDELHDALIKNGMEIHGVGPTFSRKRTRKNGSIHTISSHIDWAATNIPDVITRKKWLPISDHAMVFSDMVVVRNKRDKYEYRRDLKGLYTQECLNFLATAYDWGKLHGEDKDVEDITNIFQDVLKSAVEKFSPYRWVRKLSIADKPPEGFRKKKIKIRNLLREGKLKEARKLHRQLTKERRKMSFERVKKDLDSGTESVYTLFQKFTKQPLNSISVRNRSGKVVTGAEAANVIANTLETKLTKLKKRVKVDVDSMKLDDPKGPHDRPFFFKPVTQRTVYKIIKSLKTSTSQDETGIPQKAFRGWADVLQYPLFCIINRSLQQGKFPDIWKTAKIVPLFKGSGDRLDSTSYRPLSMLHPAAKCLEIAVCSQLTSFLESQGLLPKSQHGFRRKRSTVSAAADLIDWLDDIKAEGRTGGILMFDYSAAFDMVSNVVLRRKLEAQGANTNIRDWFDSYMSNRRLKVYLDGNWSNTFVVDSSVPQGSSLSPMAYLACCYDVTEFLDVMGKVKSIVYADDTSTAIAGGDQKELLLSMEGVGKEMNKYSSMNGLCLNLSKTVWMLMGKRKAERKITMEGSKITESNKVKFLGIYLSKVIDGMTHITSIKRDIYYRISMLRRLSHYLPNHITLKYLQPHLMSKVEYCMDVYADISQKRKFNVVEQMERFGKEGIRGCLDLWKSDRKSSEWLWQKSGLKPTRFRLLERTLMSAFDILSPKGKWSWMMTRQTGMRSRGRAASEKSHIRALSRPDGDGLISKCVRVWSQVPKEIREIKGRSAFNKKIREKEFQESLLQRLQNPDVTTT